MIKGIGLTVIIDQLKKEHTKSVIMHMLLSVLPEGTLLFSAEKYTKFKEAYKLEYTLSVTEKISKENQINQLMLLAERISTPWSVYHDHDGYNTELIFNRAAHTKVTKPVFSHIRWAHLQWMY